MKYCSNCGNEMSDDAKFCSKCGKESIDIVHNDNDISEQESNIQILNNSIPHIVCPNCGSSNVQTQVITEQKQTGCLMILFYILLAVTLVGIPILIIYLLARGKKTKKETVCVCQSCGHSFKKPSSKKDQKKKKRNNIIIAIIIVIVFIFLGIELSETNTVNTVAYNKK